VSFELKVERQRDRVGRVRRIHRLRDLKTRSDGVPTIMGHHDVNDTEHWLASPKRKQVFGPLGVSNIRTFVNPDDPKKVGVVMDVADMDALTAFMETQEAADAMAHDGVLPETLVLLVEQEPV
jgi:hypothetical protein